MFILLVCGAAWGQGRTRLAGPKVEFSVGGAMDGTIADFKSVQQAVTAAPAGGAVIRIRPGVYREAVHVEKAGIELRGEGKNAAKVLIVNDTWALDTCGTSCSATMLVIGDDFYAEGITIANDLGREGKPRMQAVALAIRGDRAVLRNVRLLGLQDTLVAGSKPCGAEAFCAASRQFFEACYVEGVEGLIGGNAKVAFEGCEIRSVAYASSGPVGTPNGAQGGAQIGRAGEGAEFVFDHCRLTASARAGKDYPGWPWPDAARVVLLHTRIEEAAQAGTYPGKTEPLAVAKFAEYDTSGPGGARVREEFAKQLTSAEAKAYEPGNFLRGADGWAPEKMH